MMKPLKIWVAVVVTILLLVGCHQEQHANLSVVASTTMIKSIVDQIGGSRLEVTAIVPGGMCPGHFDISPSQMTRITTADLFLYQGWERWAQDLARSNKDFSSAKPVGIEGNWLIPDIHLEAIDRIKDILIAADSRGRSIYEDNAKAYADSVRREGHILKDRFKTYAGTRVICSKLQADFLTWLGLDVVATFDRQEDLTPRQLSTLISLGRDQNVKVVVDNLQSGLRVGSQIARELGAIHAVLSNFPLEGSYLETLRQDADELEAKLKEVQSS